jgi:hypothetical protein
MSGCLVELIFRLVGMVFEAIFRLIGFVLMLMVAAVSSLFVGVDEATDRIADSWLEQTAGAGVNIGYSPAAREGAKAAAGFMLVVGWLLSIGAIWLIVSMIANG